MWWKLCIATWRAQKSDEVVLAYKLVEGMKNEKVLVSEWQEYVGIVSILCKSQGRRWMR